MAQYLNSSDELDGYQKSGQDVDTGQDGHGEQWAESRSQPASAGGPREHRAASSGDETRHETVAEVLASMGYKPDRTPQWKVGFKRPSLNNLKTTCTCILQAGLYTYHSEEIHSIISIVTIL